MKIIEIKDRTLMLINELLVLWEDSVKATHSFLSIKEIENIKKYVPQAIKEIPHLIIAEDERNMPIAFIGINNQMIEMLFVKNNERGKGIGKALLSYSIEHFHINEVTVNEQNPKAKGFYEHIGFRVYKRSELDEQGNPYPILHMRLER